MKAAVFYAKHDVRIEDVVEKPPLGNEVVVNVKMCGVCGTDTHIYEGADGSAAVDPPVILGHELSGEVVQVGKDVQYITVGDRVCVDPNDMCGECYFCREGKSNFCENHLAIGTIANGGFAEYITVREKQIYHIPESITFEEAAFAEPLACCLNALNRINLQAGDTVLIFGGGTIGQLMLQLVKHAGAARIIVGEPVAAKRQRAQQNGADIVLDPLSENIERLLKEQGVRNIDQVIECVGKKETIQHAFELAGKGAGVMLFGLTDPQCEVPLKPYEVFRKELTITSSFINPYTFNRAIALLASHSIQVKDLIAGVIDLEKMLPIFHDDSLRKQGKVLIRP